jgi:hypothetical protein
MEAGTGGHPVLNLGVTFQAAKAARTRAEIMARGALQDALQGLMGARQGARRYLCGRRESEDEQTHHERVHLFGPADWHGIVQKH